MSDYVAVDLGELDQQVGERMRATSAVDAAYSVLWRLSRSIDVPEDDLPDFVYVPVDTTSLAHVLNKGSLPMQVVTDALCVRPSTGLEELRSSLPLPTWCEARYSYHGAGKRPTAAFFRLDVTDQRPSGPYIQVESRALIRCRSGWARSGWAGDLGIALYHYADGTGQAVGQLVVDLLREFGLDAAAFATPSHAADLIRCVLNLVADLDALADYPSHLRLYLCNTPPPDANGWNQRSSVDVPMAVVADGEDSLTTVALLPLAGDGIGAVHEIGVPASTTPSQLVGAYDVLVEIASPRGFRIAFSKE